MPLPFQPKPLDADAAAFIQRSGATDRAAINAFVRGVKALGLWNNMVCWPLRRTQNTGTGTTAYSLGGLATINGSLIGGPTWGANGVTFDGTDDYIEISNPARTTALAAYSIFSIFDSDQTIQRTVFGSAGIASSALGPGIFAGGSPVQGNVAANLFHDLSSNGTTQIAGAGNPGRLITSGNTGVWQMAFAGFSGTEVGFSTSTVARGTTAVASTTAWNDNAIWRMGTRPNNAYYFLGLQAFNLFSTTYFTTQQTDSLYTLYKATLGTGLGLP